MQVDRIAEGLWRWTARYPDEGDAGEVSCAYVEAPDAIVLIDPLVPPDGSDDRERFWRALDRDVERLGVPLAVVLTVPRHERSAREVAARYGARVVGHVSTAAGRPVTDRVAGGDALPGGLVGIELGPYPGELLVHVPRHRALVAGDALRGLGDGRLALAPPRGGGGDVAPLAALDVDHVLVGHGPPVVGTGRAALAAALAALPAG
ncbi:MAG: hypothetical protein R3C15_04760 [Thermoleophilia bacterium]